MGGRWWSEYSGATDIARGLHALLMLERGVQIAAGAAACLEPTPENLRMFFLALHVELSEVLQETNFKMWKKDREINAERILDEWADAMAFFALDMLLLMKLTGRGVEDFVDAFVTKSALNIERIGGRVEGYGYAAAAEGEID